MPRGYNRNRDAETTTEQTEETTAVTDTAETTTERTPRPKVEIGEITIRKSTREITRGSRSAASRDTPLFKTLEASVEGTEMFGVVQEVHTTNPDGVKSLLRRYATQIPGLGVSISPETPDSDETDGAKIVIFKTKAKKQVKAKDDAAEPATAAEAEAHNAGVDV